MLLSDSSKQELLIQRLKNTLEEGSEFSFIDHAQALECLVQNYIEDYLVPFFLTVNEPLK